MRLIDADALSRALAEMWYDSPISVTGVSVSELINKQPSIDLVRCKDCKHWDTADGECYADRGIYFPNADDYCSYGERSEE